MKRGMREGRDVGRKRRMERTDKEGRDERMKRGKRCRKEETNGKDGQRRTG